MRGPRVPLAALLALPLLAALPSGSAGQAAPANGDHAASVNAPRPGDLIRLSVWREPELSGEFPIDASGEVVLPRLGPMHVTDDSPEALKERIVSAYERFLTHSSIDVDVLRRIQVLGAVRNPGLYPVDATMRVSDALALAGGATPEGRPDRVHLVRNGERIEGRLTLEAPLAATPMRSGDQLIVPERSWLSRNTGIVAAAMTASASLFIALFTR